MTYQLYAPAPQEVEQQFMPATSNLVLGLLAAAVDDIIGFFVLCGEAADEFLYRLRQEISATMFLVMRHLRTKRK